MAPLVHQLVQRNKRPCFRCQAERACLRSCARGGERRRVACVGISSRRSDRCRLDMLAKGPWSARACLARARAPNGAWGFPRFNFALFVFHLRAAAPTVLGAAGAALGAARPWPPPVPPVQGTPLDFLLTPPKNI